VEDEIVEDDLCAINKDYKKMSNSICNQLELLKKQASQIKGYEYPMTRILEYYDDGYTGTNFNRPMFQKMIKEIKFKEIDCIIVKDFSRLGRNYIEVSDYIERFFPTIGVRFISVSDHYDSLYKNYSYDSTNIFLTNLINDYYSKDLSKKVKSAIQTKKKQGCYIGSSCIYGYKKSEEDNHYMVIDIFAGTVVKDIFNMSLNGYSCTEIASKLNKSGILPPKAYKAQQKETLDASYLNNSNTKQTIWNRHNVVKILRDERYTGKYISKIFNKKRLIKNDLISHNDFEDRIEISDHHEPIVSEDIYNRVQKNLNKKVKKQYQNNKKNILRGKVKCGCCKYAMVKTKRKNKICYQCNTYKYDNQRCQSNNIITEVELLFLVRTSIEKVLSTFYEKALNPSIQPKDSGIRCKKVSIEDSRITEADKSKPEGFGYNDEKYNPEIIMLYMDYKQNKISMDEYLKKKISLEGEKKRFHYESGEKMEQEVIEKEIKDEINKYINDVETEQIETEQIDKEQIKTDITTLSETEALNKLIPIMIKTLYIHEQKRIEIVYGFGDIWS
jgi:DNA invertase Pin-like site-specific DNA recombinase